MKKYKKYFIVALVVFLLILANILQSTIFKTSDFNVFPVTLVVIIISLIIVNIMSIPNTKQNKSIFVPMSVGKGYTFNLQNKWVVLVMVLVVGALLIQYLI